MSVTDPKQASPPPIWALRCVSMLALVFALVAFTAATVLLNRNSSGDIVAAAIAGFIGCILITSSVYTFHRSRQVARGSACSASRHKIIWLRVAVLPLSILAIYGGIDFLGNAVILANQEYLHWFEFNTRYTSASHGLFALLIEFFATAFFLISVGLFFVWYSFLYNPEPYAVLISSDDSALSPYRPPERTCGEVTIA